MLDACAPGYTKRQRQHNWGWAPRDAETRLSRWRKGIKSMSADALLQLLVALDLTITEETTR